jgi:DNA-binding IclR family transcriptional regulator
MSNWTFITNHAQVLLSIAADRERTVSEIAREAQITERSAFRILADLQRAGYIRRRKTGRRNRYELNYRMILEDPAIDGRSIRDLISLVDRPLDQVSDAPPRTSATAARPRRRSGRP